MKLMCLSLCRRPLAAAALALALTTASAPAADRSRTQGAIQADFPFQSACIGMGYNSAGTGNRQKLAINNANKGIAIRVGTNAYACYDTDLMRVSVGWLGAGLDFNGVTFSGGHGGHPAIVGSPQFVTRSGPGWADANGEFTDPRPEPFGPLPEAWCRYDGLYAIGNEIVLAGTVHDTKIHEQVTTVPAGDTTAFRRALKVSATNRKLTTVVAEVADGTAETDGKVATLKSGESLLHVALGSVPTGVRLAAAGGRLTLEIPADMPASLFHVILLKGPATARAQAIELAGAPAVLADVSQGGPRRWPQSVITHGTLGATTSPYVVDRLNPPIQNPWNRRLRTAGLAFFKDGKRAAVSTWDGDVWLLSGISESLTNLTWTRYASGLFEPLGLEIINEQIYVSGRDQITRFKDLNNDGEADYYENFNNQVTSSPGFHEFQFDLQADAAGNLYTIKAGPVRGGGSGFGDPDDTNPGNGKVTSSAGTLQKISADGKKREIVATGFRAPNGIGVRADGQLTSGDNEGTWMPTCPLNWVKPGGFYGVETLAHVPKDRMPTNHLPLCWISKSWDNSGGGQVWVTSERWGPFKDRLLHLSYGRCAVYLALPQEIDGLMQGGLVRIAGGGRDVSEFVHDQSGSDRRSVALSSSAMRARFNPADGQLYVLGLQGWQTDAPKLSGLDRIRYTGKTIRSITALKVTSTGLSLTFTEPLDPTAVIPDNFSAERWNYKRTGGYGSPEVSVTTGKSGHDKVAVKAARLSTDGRTVSLDLEDHRPCHQLQLRYNLLARDGAKVQQTVMQTIHVVPGGTTAQLR